MNSLQNFGAQPILLNLNLYKNPLELKNNITNLSQRPPASTKSIEKKHNSIDQLVPLDARSQSKSTRSLLSQFG